VLSSAPGEEQPQTPVYAGGTPGKLERGLAEKDLGILVGTRLKIRQ